jgi:hypothetical protein
LFVHNILIRKLAALGDAVPIYDRKEWLLAEHYTLVGLEITRRSNLFRLLMLGKEAIDLARGPQLLDLFPKPCEKDPMKRILRV